MFEKFKKCKELLEMSISGLLMLGLLFNEKTFNEFSFFTVIYALLAFIIILELVRMVIEYIITHHISIRIVIDTFIIFMLREAVLMYSDKEMDLYEKGLYISGGLIIIYILFGFRKIAMENSPTEKCHNCELSSEKQIEKS